MAALA
jgi:hypothetical protein